MAVLAKAKGQVYANEAERIKLEDYYRKAWIAKNLEDVEKKPELKIKSHFKSQKQMKKNSEPVSANPNHEVTIIAHSTSHSNSSSIGQKHTH